ncbi:MAG: tryptophan synthase subunit alpha [Phycisphaeraceae bacterium]|nr:tryptophan synthase subunit alpha [Phycisphaeraceae bacterium]
MNRIESIFSEARSQHRKLLMPFVCGGRPTLESLPGLLGTLERSGASIVEIGFPFSDPIADGPVIAAAMHRALLEGVTPAGLFGSIRTARERVSLGLVGMVSMSIVARMGLARFTTEAAACGLDGLIVPDCPVEESGALAEAARDAGLTLTLLVAPTTTGERLERIVAACSGFVYLMARLGITGESSGPAEVRGRVEQIRGMSPLPIACGFGISSAAHVAAVTGDADAAIVGSALVRRMEEATDAGTDAVEAAGQFTAELAQGLAGAR